ncbi:hypothetical protein ACIA49_38795 [Kribbella sp. NPDC051587]|uniref:hypothetical protein n=1 Tax=Kribbella sp. NPDC051587 TaxID=3364119 RepID=UPI0037883BBF
MTGREDPDSPVSGTPWTVEQRRGLKGLCTQLARLRTGTVLPGLARHHPEHPQLLELAAQLDELELLADRALHMQAGDPDILLVDAQLHEAIQHITWTGPNT